MRFTLAYDPYATDHRDAAKRREAVREWMVQRENQAEPFQLAVETASADLSLHEAA